MLNIVSIYPSDKSINIPVDNKIQITFNEPIDQFTIHNGISLYTTSDGIWTGSELSKLDTKYSDVLSVSDDYHNVQYTYTINDNILTIIPSSNLLDNKTYYISIFPGTDFTRVVSTKTFDTPIVTSASSGTIEVVSSYLGNDNGTYNLNFTGSNTFDLAFNLIYQDSLTFEGSEEISLGNINIKLNGIFSLGDVIEIPVYKGSSVESLYKTCFTTNKYTVSQPTSQKIDDNTYNEEPIFNITNSIPENNSVNNSPCNPITIRFNSNINPTQDLLNKISIKRISLIDGKTKLLNYKYRIFNNILKIYLTS